jgi:hypothetical protein
VSAAARLGAYAAGLAVVFAGAFAAGGALVPDETVAAWTQQAEGLRMDQHPAPAEAPDTTAEIETDGGH